MRITQCQIGSCTGRVYALGLCRPCYMIARARRLGRCTTPRCPNWVHTRGLCNTCYQALRNGWHRTI